MLRNGSLLTLLKTGVMDDVTGDFVSSSMTLGVFNTLVKLKGRVLMEQTCNGLVSDFGVL